MIERYAAPVRMRPQYKAGKYVDSELEVDGETLRTTPSIRQGRTFSVGEIAGVVLGGCTGSNVLYDRDFQVLEKFAWSMDGADLLALYLLEHGIAFDNLPLALDRRSSQKPVKPTPQVGGGKTERH